MFEELVRDQPCEDDDQEVELLARVEPSGVLVELAVHVFCRVVDTKRRL
jgi:hypothetical protein